MAIIQNLVARLTLDSTAFDRNSKRSGQSMKAMQSQTLALQRTVVGLTAAYYAGRGLIRALESMTSAAVEGERAQNRLYALMRNVAGTTSDQAAAIVQLTERMQEYTTVGDDVGQVGASQLATFQLTADSIKQLLPSLYDAAVATKGVHVEQKEMIDIANILGKAMMGQTGMLSRYGITMSDVQREILQTGKESERTAMLVEVLQQNFGGLAEAAAQTTEGMREQAALAWGDVREGLGKVLLPSYKTAFETIRDYLKTNQRDMESWANGTLAILGAVADAYATVQRGFADLAEKTLGDNEIIRAAKEAYRNEAGDTGAFTETFVAGPGGGGVDIVPPKDPFGGQKGDGMKRYQAILAKMRAEQQGVVADRETLRLEIGNRPPMTGGYALPTFGEGGMAPGETADGGSDAVEDAQQTTTDIAAAYRAMFADMDESTEESFKVRQGLLELERDKYVTATKDKATVLRWFAEQERKLAEEQAIATGGLFEGFAAQTEKMQIELQTAGENGAELAVVLRDGVGGALADAVLEGKKLNDILSSVGRSLARTALNQIGNESATWLMAAGKTLLGGPGGGRGETTTPGDFGDVDADIKPSAKGNAFGPRGVIPFDRGGIFSQPTLFPFAAGTGLMGEAGPEAIMPLRRGPGGRLGVEARGGGGMSTSRIEQLLEAIAAKNTSPQVVVVQSKEEILNVMRSRRGREVMMDTQQKYGGQ